VNLHRTTGRQGLGLTLALFTAGVWGSLPIALKVLLAALDPFTLTCSRFLLASVLLALLGVHRQGLPVRAIGAGYLLLLAVAGAGLGGNYVFYQMGLRHISPSTAQIVAQLSPMFMMVGSLVLFKERFTRLQWLGFAVLLGGLFLYFNERLEELLYGLRELTRGVLLILAAAVGWASYALAQKQLLERLDPTFVLFVLYLGGGLLLLPLTSPARLVDLSWPQFALLGGTALATLLSYRSFAGALQHLEGSRVSIVISLSPLVTVAGVSLIGPLVPELIQPDPLNPASVGGALLVVSGSVLTALGRKR